MVISKNKPIPKIFRHFGENIAPYFINIEIDLSQARIKKSLNEHIALSIFKSANLSLLVLVSFLLLGLFTRISSIYMLGIVIVPILFMFSLYSELYQPKIIAKKRGRELDRELPYALRHLLINIRSGIPLYNALVSISENYGEISLEMKHILKQINGGKSEIEAIEESVITSPSYLYRKSFWQILNALRTGTDIEKPLKTSVNNIIKEQMISIKKYGQELNPFTMMYMMIGVIMPSLGITLFMLLSTFVGTGFGNKVFYLILVFLVGFQIFFINVVKTKRPLVRL
ncbi:MAG: type II secretion system F family protein [DPANN group archaeon]|nr:type II secretion system F family protein [DPANN group archaeon]